jgi:hypothetical protein
MAEVLVSFSEMVASSEGGVYTARACGREMPDGRWEGWLEFEPADGSDPIRSGRETTQPNRTDTEYWATGLTPVYLEGALARALNPASVTPPRAESTPSFDGPLAHGSQQTPPRNESVLNPFSVYRKGEPLLRRQLGALAGWHLVNIVEAYELSRRSSDELSQLDDATLIELIVSQVRESEEALKGS